MSAEESWGDPFARFYRQYPDDPSHWREMLERVGRIVITWGAMENALAKLWWHLAFEAGRELDPEKVYREPLSGKIAKIRKLVPRDGARRDLQLARIEAAVLVVEPDRHALVHGYLGLTSRGPASVNLKDGHRTYGDRLPLLKEWAEYLADVAHQLHEEATCHIYRGVDQIFLPDPVEPAAYDVS